MTDFRVSLSFPCDGTLPRDAVTINPHFNGTDAQGLATALKNNLLAWNPTATAPVNIKVYDAGKPPPSFPLATASNPGSPPVSGNPREVALCLSYYTTYNRPRYRGRLYLPASWFGTGMGVKPTSGIMNAALAFGAEILRKSLPSGTVWTVYSTTEKKSQGAVSDAWVDDEWDTVRSRGLRASSRVTVKY
jgi:hypothetical protein